MLSLPFPWATSCLWICLVLWGPVWVVWPYPGFCGQSLGLKNRLRAEADIDNQGRDRARTGREHAGKKAQCFLRDWPVNQISTSLKVSILPLQSFHLSHHFTLQSPALQFLAYTLKNQDPHYSRFYLCKTLESESIAKCPWPSKKCTNIIYVHPFLKQKSHFPLPNAIFYSRSARWVKSYISSASHFL